MRRNDREVTNKTEICSIIDKCKVMRMAMSLENQPFILPMNFGYRWEKELPTFYFHCAKEGEKLEILTQNPKVALEIDCEHQLVSGEEVACRYGFAYQSVIGRGSVAEVTDPNKKAKALSLLMRHQTGRDFAFTEVMTQSVFVGEITLEVLTAKARTV